MYRMSFLEGKEFLCVLNQENVKKAGKAPEALSPFPLKTNYCQRETKRKANLGNVIAWLAKNSSQKTKSLTNTLLKFIETTNVENSKRDQWYQFSHNENADMQKGNRIHLM